MDELREIVEIIEKAKIDLLKLEKGDFKLYYKKEGSQGLQIKEEDCSEVITSQEVDSEFIEQTLGQKEMNNKQDFHQITSPMLGAFHSRPSPDKEPFVQIGSIISNQDTVCVLEAMKLLNEIRSEVNGEIIEVLVEDGQIIEYGQPLFTVKVSE